MPLFFSAFPLLLLSFSHGSILSWAQDYAKKLENDAMHMMSQVTTARQGAMEAMKVGRIPRSRASLSIALFLVPHSSSLIRLQHISFTLCPLCSCPSSPLPGSCPVCRSVHFCSPPSASTSYPLVSILQAGIPPLPPMSQPAPTTCPFPGPKPKSQIPDPEPYIPGPEPKS